MPHPDPKPDPDPYLALMVPDPGGPTFNSFSAKREYAEWYFPVGQAKIFIAFFSLPDICNIPSPMVEYWPYGVLISCLKILAHSRNTLNTFKVRQKKKLKSLLSILDSGYHGKVKKTISRYCPFKLVNYWLTVSWSRRSSSGLSLKLFSISWSERFFQFSDSVSRAAFSTLRFPTFSSSSLIFPWNKRVIARQISGIFKKTLKKDKNFRKCRLFSAFFSLIVNLHDK